MELHWPALMPTIPYMVETLTSLGDVISPLNYRYGEFTFKMNPCLYFRCLYWYGNLYGPSTHDFPVEKNIRAEAGMLVVLVFNATLTAKVISWRSVTHKRFLAFSHQY